MVGFTKFFVFFKVENLQPELYEVLAGQIKKRLNYLTIDEMLTCLVNFSFSLSPETSELFELVNDEIVYRLDVNFNAAKRELYVKGEDFPKIINTLQDYR